MLIIRKLCISLLVLLLPVAGVAQNLSPDDLTETQKRMLKASDGYALNTATELLEPQDALRLVLVARQYAAGHSCEALEIDYDKYNTVMQSVVEQLSALTEGGDNNLPVDAVMAAFSTSLGGHLAAAAYDLDTYCETATALRETFRSGELAERVLILK